MKQECCKCKKELKFDFEIKKKTNIICTPCIRKEFKKQGRDYDKMMELIKKGGFD